MKHVNYKDWASYIREISGHYINNSANVLELAAGNCKLTGYLKKNFHSYISTDLSFSMLKAAKKKVNRVVCDMTSLPFKKKFDLVICAFDSVNYLLSETRLKKLFTEVKLVISKKGIFTFDASLEKNSLINAEDRIVTGNYKGYKYEKLSEYDSESCIHTNLFKLEKENQIYTEKHLQRIYTPDTYFRLLDETGFQVLECFDAFSFDDYDSDSDRLQFVVRKK